MKNGDIILWLVAAAIAWFVIQPMWIKSDIPTPSEMIFGTDSNYAGYY